MGLYVTERLKASAYHQLCIPLLPFNHARSKSINADSLNSNFLQLGRRSGGRPPESRLPVEQKSASVINTLSSKTLIQSYLAMNTTIC